MYFTEEALYFCEFVAVFGHYLPIIERIKDLKISGCMT